MQLLGFLSWPELLCLASGSAVSYPRNVLPTPGLDGEGKDLSALEVNRTLAIDFQEATLKYRNGACPPMQVGMGMLAG